MSKVFDWCVVDSVYKYKRTEEVDEEGVPPALLELGDDELQRALQHLRVFGLVFGD